MRWSIKLAAVGKLGKGPEADLAARYTKRLRWPFIMAEIPESRLAIAAARKAAEAEKLSRAVEGSDRRIVLDETGQALTTANLQTQLQDWQSAGAASLGLIIGGPDGLDPQLLRQSDLVLSFGGLTWPHKLVRVLVLEQLYRQYTLSVHHPYHRA